jgi:CheY-like chemotaxis protein
MDGYTVAEQLRNSPEACGCRLVALTGYGRDSDRRRAEEAGFDLHLVKPVEPAQLQRLLDGWGTER